MTSTTKLLNTNILDQRVWTERCVWFSIQIIVCGRIARCNLFVQMLPWHSLTVCHVHIYTSYTTSRCGNRKMAERIELIFTMETDSPV